MITALEPQQLAKQLNALLSISIHSWLENELTLDARRKVATVDAKQQMQYSTSSLPGKRRREHSK